MGTTIEKNRPKEVMLREALTLKQLSELDISSNEKSIFKKRAERMLKKANKIKTNK